MDQMGGPPRARDLESSFLAKEVYVPGKEAKPLAEETSAWMRTGPLTLEGTKHASPFLLLVSERLRNRDRSVGGGGVDGES
jgi:hypothetical protein